ncbi:MAG: GNVR domain-containing protein [Candidatus Rokuibacteriota bacterium]
MTEPREADFGKPLKDHLRVLRKHLWLITGLFLITVITGAIWTFLQVPIFQATATLLIEPEAPKFLNIQEVTPMGAAAPWDPNYYPTQYEIMKSRAVLEMAIEALNGKKRGPYRAVLGSLQVQPVRNTRLVRITVEDPDPALAAQVVNAVATAYVHYNLGLKLRGSQEALTWLTEEAARLRAKVQESSVALQNYRVKAGILGLQEQRQITAQKIMDFNKAYLETQAQRLSVESKLRELNQIAKDKAGAQTIFTVADNPLIQKLKAEASDLAVERSKLVKIFREKHPEILKIDARIRQVDQQLDAEIQTMLRAVGTESKVARAREETLLSNVNQLRREGQELNEKEIQYLNLQREVETNQQLYESVLKRLKETGVTGGLETNNVKVVEPAFPPTVPVKPRKVLNLALSLLVGLGLGIGVAVALEYFDTTVKTPDDVERYLGLPVIGIVPAYKGKH